MANTPDVLNRLEEIEQRWSCSVATATLQGSPSADVHYLLRLTRALLASNQALVETHGLPCLRLDPRRCPDVLRAEAVRRGEGL